MNNKFLFFIILSVAILFGYNSLVKLNSNPSGQEVKSNLKSLNNKVDLPIGKSSDENSQDLILKSEKGNKNVIENNNFLIESNDFGSKISKVVIKNYGSVSAVKKPAYLFVDEDKLKCKNLETYLVLGNKAYDLNNDNWSAEAGKNKITYRYTIRNVAEIVKEITVGDENYSGNVTFSIKNVSNSVLPVNKFSTFWGQLSALKSSPVNESLIQAVVYSNGKLTRIKSGKKDLTNTFEIHSGWISLRDQYFCSIFSVDSENILKNVDISKHLSGQIDLLFNFNLSDIAPNQTALYKINFYFGPQDYSILSKFGTYSKIIDFGIFEYISVILLFILKFFYGVTKNYGFSIILLTVLVRVVLWWPTQKSYSSMKKMQKSMNQMQPRLKTLKEVYKNNPAKLNEETMKLYKEYQINPMGGCLPMLLQMPIFFALYSTLNSSVELKGSEFIWIWKDLSTKDPMYILPLAMGISMFIQQKISSPPSATPEAETQQKMMLYLMPIMLTFFAFMWPSGLLLYWVVSNLISIGQQVIINRKN